MKLAVVDGVVYPAGVPEVTGVDYVDVTSDQHAFLLREWAGDLVEADGEVNVTATAYYVDGSTKEATAAFKQAVADSLNKGPVGAHLEKIAKRDNDAEGKKRKHISDVLAAKFKA